MAHVVFSLNSTVLDLLNVVGLGLLLRCLVHGFWKPWPPVRGVSEALARRVRDAVSRKRKSDQRRSSNALMLACTHTNSALSFGLRYT